MITNNDQYTLEVKAEGKSEKFYFNLLRDISAIKRSEITVIFEIERPYYANVIIAANTKREVI